MRAHCLQQQRVREVLVDVFAHAAASWATSAAAEHAGEPPEDVTDAALAGLVAPRSRNDPARRRHRRRTPDSSGGLAPGIHHGEGQRARRRPRVGPGSPGAAAVT